MGAMLEPELIARNSTIVDVAAFGVKLKLIFWVLDELLLKKLAALITEFPMGTALTPEYVKRKKDHAVAEALIVNVPLAAGLGT